MKKLTAEEASKIHIIKKGKHSWLYRELAQLQKGEAIIVLLNEWKGKNTPYKVIRKAAENLKMQFDWGRAPDGSGWIVKRLG